MITALGEHDVFWCFDSWLLLSFSNWGLGIFSAFKLSMTVFPLNDEF